MNQPAPTGNLRFRLAAATASIAVSILLLAVKFYAWHLTRSSAILSDALESIINVVASGFALASVIVAAKPPDQDHPFGHGKIEFFSAGFEGGLIFVAAFGIFATGWQRLSAPGSIPHLDQGVLLLSAAGVVNLVLGLWLIRVGNRSRSLALIADGKHLLADVVTSAGVLVGLLLVLVTGWYRLDGMIACLVGLNILLTGARLLNQAFGGLMDRADTALTGEIVDLLNRHRKDAWIDVHQLRVVRSGSRVNVDLHLILPRDLQLEEAHSQAKAAERVIIDHFNGEAGVLIHMDPCIENDCPVCSDGSCNLRANDGPGRAEWTRESATAAGWGGDRLDGQRSMAAVSLEKKTE